MTVTLVFGDPTDGYVSSTNAAYATARTGPGTNVDSNFEQTFIGQRPTYSLFQSFVRFTYSSGAGELITSAAIRLTLATNVSTGVARDMEVRQFDWGTSLTTADWRNGTQLSALPLHGRVAGVQAATGKTTFTGSDDLRALLQSGGVASFVVASSRMRAGTTPTVDETSSFYSADRAGTAEDPCLIFTSTRDHGLVPALGGEVQLSDGSTAFLVPVVGGVEVRHQVGTADSTLVATVPLGTGTSEWADVAGAQGMALAVDSADNLFVVGRAGNAPNSLRHRAYIKGAGYTWTAGTIRTLPLQAHSGVVNNVAATWTPAGGGTVVVFAGHAAGDAESGGDGGDVAYALLNSQYLLDGVTGSQNRGTGSATGLSLVPPSTPSTDFNGWVNESGTGLDVVMDHFQTDWGYVASFQRGQRLGDNGAVSIGRFKLNSTASGFDHSSYSISTSYGKKDAAGKVRVLSVGSGQVVLMTADQDAGYGITLQALQSQGLTPGWVVLGQVYLAGESIPTMPDGPAVAGSAAWDAVYSSTENAIWVYYVDAGNAARIMRTSVDLDTYQATRTEVAVRTMGGAVRALRTPRNSWTTQATHYSVASLSGATERADWFHETLNQPPLAPTLTPRFNYDATQAATFAWTFQDPNVGDTQSAYQLQVQRTSDSVTVLDTGKVASSAQSRSVAGGTLVNGVDYRWRVQTWDALDTLGPWSDWGTFSTGAAGTVTITDPATDNPPNIITDDYLVAWSVAGTTQTKARVWVTRNDTGATVYDSGWLTTSTTTRTITGMVSDVTHTINVQVENASAVQSGIGTRLITPSYGTPEVPLVTLTPVPDGGYVLVAVDNPIPGTSVDPGQMWDFEDGTTEPLTSTSVTMASSTAFAHKGSRSIQTTTTASPALVRVKSTSAKAVVPGQRYTASFWCYSTTGYASHVAAINWRPAADPAGATISTSTGSVTNVPANTWTQVTVSAQAPAGAGWAVYGPGFSPSPANGYVFYVDELSMVVASDRPDVAVNTILRRRAGSQGPWEVLGECGPDGTFRDYEAPSQVPVEYMVRGESA